MSYISTIIEVPETADQQKSLIPVGSGSNNPGVKNVMTDYINHLNGLIGGAKDFSEFSIGLGGVKATGTLTVSSTGSANTQECTIGNVTLTAVTSGADRSAGEFNINSDPVAQAADMVLTINSYASLLPLVTATSEEVGSPSEGVITLTSQVPGLIGNATELSAGNLANVTATAFSGGTTDSGFTYTE